MSVPGDERIEVFRIDEGLPERTNPWRCRVDDVLLWFKRDEIMRAKQFPDRESALKAGREYLWDRPESSQLDDDHDLRLVNEQIKGLLEGEGATEDHESVIAFLLATGLPPGTVKRVHLAIVNGDLKVVNER